MTGLPIPLDALEDCGLVLGRRGAGKSGTRTLFLEHELDRGRRCCLIDPKGDSWGIRLNPDGSPSRFQKVAIFGGFHGDYELSDEMGETLGRLVATHNLSCIIDMSSLSIAGMRRFARDFAEALFDNNTQPLTLFVDEVDQLAPQPLPKDMTVLLHRMDRLIRQGRHRGIFMWMFTQRPQVLHPNLRSQAELLIVMRLTTPLERKAAEEWLEAHDPDQAKALLPTLAKLATGEAWAWVPAADFLERVQFPLFSTFDSMRTPRHGEQVAQVSLPPIDTSEIAAALGAAAVEARTEKALGAYAAGAEVGQLLIEKEGRIRALEDDREQLTAEVARLMELVGRREAQLRSIGETVNGHLRAIENPELDLTCANSHEIAGKAGEGASSHPRQPPAGEGEARPNVTRAAASPVSRAARADGEPHPLALTLGEKMAAIAPAKLTWRQLASMAGYSPDGGYFRAGKRDALNRRLLVEEGSYVRAPGASGQPLTRAAAFDLWSQILPQPAGRIMEALRAEGLMFKGRLAAALGYSMSGGYFRGGIALLRQNGVIVETGDDVELAEQLPGEAA